MAALICPVCGGGNFEPDVTLCPTHMEPLVPDESGTPPPTPPPTAPPPTTCAEPGCTYPAGQCPVHPAGAPSAGGITRFDGGGRLALHFPWGVVEIPDSGLTVGRSALSSPLATRITDEEYGNVSRRHATISRNGDRLQVLDFGSTNHTFVNEKQIPDHTPHELRAGDEVRFAADLRVTVVEHR